MTTKNMTEQPDICPAQGLLKILSGKWKAQIFRLAVAGALRFNELLRQLEGSNKQSLTTALRELEKEGILDRVVIKEKPLHVEYLLSDKGRSLIPVFEQLELLS